jgi:hypothetical protein
MELDRWEHPLQIERHKDGREQDCRDQGALTGIGRAGSYALASEGATVVVSGRREAHGESLADGH